MLHAVSVCVSVCVSVTVVHSVKTNKDIFEIFASSGSHNILGVVGRNHDSEPIAGFNACNRPGVVNTAGGGPRPPSRKLWHLYRWSYTAGIWPPSATRDHRRHGSTARDRPSALSHYTQSRLTVNRCMTARLDVTPKTTEQNRIVRTGKSEAGVTNNKKKLRSRYCTIKATKLTTDRHEASRGLFATAELLVMWVLKG